MQCPWCSRKIGYLQLGRYSFKCPYCHGRASYAFEFGKVLPGWVIGGVATWLAPTPCGPIVLALGFAIPLYIGMYLKKSH